ncbi:MAG: response regulator transcription factor [Myxococcales bacterium FL481]|nr:MAG: response regulator transcription factor [Myxococcales bacterium FL481]
MSQVPFIRVVLAEDHTVVREGLRSLLEAEPDVHVVAEATDGFGALQACENHRPDVVLMDIGLPRLNGIDATRQIVGQYAGTKVLVLSMHSSEEYVRPAVRAGASGYLVKGSGIADVISAIRAIHRGDAFFSPAVARWLLTDTAPASPQLRAADSLTPREREVLTLVADGRSSPEIASDLGLSVKTVEGHRSRMMAKLEARNVAALVRHAIRLGLVPAE